MTLSRPMGVALFGRTHDNAAARTLIFKTSLAAFQIYTRGLTIGGGCVMSRDKDDARVAQCGEDGAHARRGRPVTAAAELRGEVTTLRLPTSSPPPQRLLDQLSFARWCRSGIYSALASFGHTQVTETRRGRMDSTQRLPTAPDTQPPAYLLTAPPSSTSSHGAIPHTTIVSTRHTTPPSVPHSPGAAKTTSRRRNRRRADNSGAEAHNNRPHRPPLVYRSAGSNGPLDMQIGWIWPVQTQATWSDSTVFCSPPEIDWKRKVGSPAGGLR